jgi:Na+/H+ antiporter NhaA
MEGGGVRSVRLRGDASDSRTPVAGPDRARRPALGDVTQWMAREGLPSAASFLRTESGSAGVLAAAIVAALCWANAGSSYSTVWALHVSVLVGDHGVGLTVREWVNSGLMTVFFMVVGLETRREFDLGELRDRRRLLLPTAAGAGGALASVAVFLLLNWGAPTQTGWGVAMSTDTALALGVLAVAGRSAPERTRVFLLTLFVIDDLVALGVIALNYSARVNPWPVAVAAVCYILLLGALTAGADVLISYLACGLLMWGAMLASGIDPLVTGLVLGLTAAAYSPDRSSLENAFGAFRRYREQPSSELAGQAVSGLTATLSPNARLQKLLHPWAGYVVVPLFALANAGVVLTGPSLDRALTSPFMWSIVAAYLLGKPFGVLVASAAVAWVGRGKTTMPVGWASVMGSGTVAGAAFTVSLLIATLAFTGEQLKQAQIAILLTVLGSMATTSLVFMVTNLMEPMRRARALAGDAEMLLDLTVPVDLQRDHVRGPVDALVTIVEYGDFECPSCRRAEASLRAGPLGADVRLVWRHLPIPEVHPHATLAAQAAEAAALQGGFWPFHDLLLAHQDQLGIDDLKRYARRVGLDEERFIEDLTSGKPAQRVAQDVASADASDVAGTPTFFINGRRHYGRHDVPALTRAVQTAATQARLTTSRRLS